MERELDLVELNDEKLKSTFNLDWDNPPKLSDLKQDYESALSNHQGQVTKIDSWLSLMEGKLHVTPLKGRSRVQPKLIRKQAEWRYASLSEPFLSSDTIFEAKPVTWEDRAASEQAELLINHQFNNQLNKVKFIDEYIRTAVDEGTVIVKVGWEYRDAEEEVEVPIIEQVPVQDPMQYQEMVQQGIPPFEEVVVGYETEVQTVIKTNKPTLEICNYANVIIDPTCQGDLDKANFVIYSYESSLKDLEVDGRYKNLDKINMQSVSSLASSDHYNDETRDFEFKDKPRKKIVVQEYWGYWDIYDNGTVEPILATYVGDTMIRLELNPFPDGKLPFVSVQYLPVRRSVYGEPDAELLEDNQKIIGAVTRGMIDLMGRSANAQQGIRKDALDVANKRKFEDGKDYMFNANIDPRQAIYMHQYPEIPNSAMQMISLMNNEAESISGVKAFNTGITGQALGNTATAVRSALDATSKRELGILRRLSNGLVEIARKFLAMSCVFLSDEEVIRVTNEEFVNIRRDDLDGSIDIHLSISTAETDNEKAQELAFMLQTMGNTVPFEITSKLLSGILKLRKMPDLAKEIAEYQPQPDPIAQEKAQLELELLKAQIANEYAKAQENQVDAAVKEQKAGVESAKARSINSRADLDDLNFIEKQTGRDVEKEMTKQTNASRAKIDEQAAKALLKYQQGMLS